MTKQQLETKLNIIAQAIEDQMIAVKEIQRELKETLTDLENIDLDELESNPNTQSEE